VEGFWQVSSEQRLDFFWDYLKAPEQGWRTREDELAVTHHQAQLDRLNELKADIRADLIPPRSTMPRTGQPFTFPAHYATSGGLRAAALAASGRRRLTPGEEQLIESYREQLRVEESLRQAAGVARGRVARPYQELAAVLEAAAHRVAADFAVVSGLTWVKGVNLEVADGARLAVRLLSAGRAPLDPVGVLSEAYLDLLALLIILEVHVECVARGQHPLLVLDDVFQSVDAPLRQRALRQICGRLKGWQVVMTVHDRLWLELAHHVLAEQDMGKAKILELRHGAHGRTPTITLAGTGPLRDVRFVLDNGGSAVLLAAAAGRALEALLDQLSVNLKCKVVRQHPEHYMIQVLLDAVAPALGNCAIERVRTLAKLVKRAQFLRNAMGAHFNMDAEGVSDQEVTDAAQHVIDLWGLLTCGTCGQLATKGANDAAGRWSPQYSCRHAAPASAGGATG
jgi:hypothetical protein